MMRTPQRGLTLIELMVALVIGLAVTLVVTTLLIAGENHKRTTTSTNDADQTGSYAFYALDRALRNAGSGIAESADVGVLGCKLNVNALLPRAAAFPAPFATKFLGAAPADLRIAPVLIGSNQSDNNTSDVLVVMGGTGAGGGVPRAINGPGDANTLILQTTVGIFKDDLVLVSQPTTPNADCLLEQVNAAPASPKLTLGGNVYYTQTGSATTLATLAGSVANYVTPLGNAQANNVQFQLFGVGTNNTLYSYDLLQNQLKVQGTGADTSQAIADGVVLLKALYGVQVTGAPGILSSWADPAIAPYDINTVMVTPATMRSIIAVHVALIVRGEYYDKNVVSPVQLNYFTGYADAAGNSLAQTYALTTTPDQRHYRYRVYEFTVPLRNMLILPAT